MADIRVGRVDPSFAWLARAIEMREGLELG
jgi:hypothetical protein